LRVSVIEHQPLLRDALTALLNSAGMHAVAEPSEPGVELSRALTARAPDVVFLGPGSAAAVLQQMPALCQTWRAIMIARADDGELQSTAIQQGVRGIVTQEQPSDIVIKAVLKVGAGEYWLARERMAGVVTTLTRVRTQGDPEKLKLMSLTPRERDIVALVAEGLANAEIATRLSIRETTARNHLTSILDKLELSNRFQLAVYALRRGLVTLPPHSSLHLTGLDDAGATPQRQRGAR
jgi:DNA-binding NarL/FixJ family response regulator